MTGTTRLTRAEKKAETRATAAWTLDLALKLLHPVSPFLTEQLWNETAEFGPPRAGYPPLLETARADLGISAGAAGLVQAGVRDGAKLFPPIKHEPTSATGIRHEDGTISMARQGPGTAQGDFFITIGPVEGFDAASGQQGDDLGYAAFGRVVEGMDVVKSLLGAPVSPTKGEKDGMKGQILETPVKILKARRLAD